MMDVGGTLKRARQRKQLTLAQLAQRTKINAHSLEAIEDNAFEKLPGDLYARGFIRAYAREVDLDPEDVVEEYRQQFEPPAAESSAAPEKPNESQRSFVPSGGDARAVFHPRRIPGSALTVAVFAIAAMVYFTWGSKERQKVAIAEHPAAPASSDAVPTAAPPAPAVDATRAAEVAPQVIRVELKATGPCWVSATVDGKPAVAKLLQPGDTETLEGKEEIVLRVGDPGTISVIVNGVPAHSLGHPRQPVTVQITRQNFRDLVGS